jgi:hypothetical protein
MAGDQDQRPGPALTPCRGLMSMAFALTRVPAAGLLSRHTLSTSSMSGDPLGSAAISSA